MHVIWNIMKRSRTGLDIRKGVLVEIASSKRDLTEITIPMEVERVAYNAFKGHEDVKINMSPEYIQQNLVERISYLLEDVREAYDNWTKPYVQFEEYGPCMPIFGMDFESISAALQETIKQQAADGSDIQWKTIVVDADDANEINRRIEEVGRDNVVTVVDGKVKTPFNLPFISTSPIQQVVTGIEALNHLIEEEGFGVIILKNLNENNYRNLPHNFIYNLTKNHSFCKVRLSPRWAVLIEVGPKVRLDAPGGTRYHFTANYFKGISTENYLKDMRRADKVIGSEELWDAYFAQTKGK